VVLEGFLGRSGWYRADVEGVPIRHGNEPGPTRFPPPGTPCSAELSSDYPRSHLYPFHYQEGDETAEHSREARPGAGAAATIRNYPGLTERLKVKVKKTTFDGVEAYIVMPETIAPENCDRVLIPHRGRATAQQARGDRGGAGGLCPVPVRRGGLQLGPAAASGVPEGVGREPGGVEGPAPAMMPRTGRTPSSPSPAAATRRPQPSRPGSGT
jgi:hypothetical protein